jgi:hypothetical protein
MGQTCNKEEKDQNFQIFLKIGNPTPGDGVSGTACLVKI